MVKTSVAGVTPPATDPHATVAIIAADTVAAAGAGAGAGNPRRRAKKRPARHPSSHSLTAILVPRT
ncbi:hypothetical protein QO002_004261 [Pararhizobium capsulatum DSM 1112]|uniref:Uncharacterized protein n=1 Tax=Pararhizobium capsulatum DSM 1112 TaxID=1121113 RepID=A0ABU0BX61_9HYPH|nr:hypothetical protein [Pararhizobium capsulatum]MDQ0322025.1 hypothetical protein [Pararhizobium capsulatum DSM 1112]MDQ0322055.1 hypothetical protein [Pararhizobium capsulatum DSM 1112]